MLEQLDLDFWAQMNEMYPDFQQKKTQEALWLGELQYPPWVAGGMAAMAPGKVQLEHFCRESEDYKMWGEWATWEGDATFPTNAMRKEWDLRNFIFVQVI